MIYYYMTIAALAFGAFSGFISLFHPNAIANVLATFGGVFFMIHITAIVCVMHLPPKLAVFSVAPIAMAWLGAALARLVSMMVDRKENGEGGINRYWVVLELVVAAMLSSSFLQVL